MSEVVNLDFLRPPFWVPDVDGDQYQERLCNQPEVTQHH